MCIIFQVQTHVNAFILQLETRSLSKQNAVCTRLDFNLDVDGTVSIVQGFVVLGNECIYTCIHVHVHMYTCMVNSLDSQKWWRFENMFQQQKKKVVWNCCIEQAMSNMYVYAEHTDLVCC